MPTDAARTAWQRAEVLDSRNRAPASLLRTHASHKRCTALRRRSPAVQRKAEGARHRRSSQALTCRLQPQRYEYSKRRLATSAVAINEPD